MTKVSIIIPAYNQAQFLVQSIESALGQSHPDLEVVVIDDGSTDRTPEAAGRFLYCPNFKYVRQSNTGLAGARNRGISESTGAYLCFLDSDDCYLPEKAARQAALLDADPDLGFVYCDITTVDEMGRPAAEQFSVAQAQRELSGNLFGSLILNGYFPPHTVMIRRAVLDRVGPFDPELGGHADYELWLRVSGAGFKAAFVPERLAVYRIHSGSMSRDGKHMNDTRLAALRKLARIHPDLVAAGVNQLQQSTHDLLIANQWLQARQVQDTGGGGSNGRAGLANGAPENALEVCRLMPRLSKAQRTKGQQDQVAVWDVKLNGAYGRALFSQPPVELVFQLPTGAPGTFLADIAMHPEVWSNPKSGGCEFYVNIDGRVAFAMAIDPVRIPGDRRWHRISLEVPEADKHQITFGTRGVGSTDFRWALWLEPRFVWKSASDDAAPPSAKSSQLISNGMP